MMTGTWLRSSLVSSWLLPCILSAAPASAQENVTGAVFEQLVEQIQLTADQRPEVELVFRLQMERLREIREKRESDELDRMGALRAFRESRDKFDGALEHVLHENQLQKLESVRGQMRAAMRARMEGGRTEDR